MDTPIALGISLRSLAQYLPHLVKVLLMPTRKYLHIVIVYILYMTDKCILYPAHASVRQPTTSQ